MPVNAKIVVMFNQFEWGWTETYYWASSTGSLGDLATVTRNLMDARGALIGTGCTIQAARVSDLDSPGSAYTDFYVNNANVGSGGASDAPWEAYMVGLISNTSLQIYGRKLLIRGCPAVWNKWVAQQADPGAMSPAMRIALDSFTGYLLNPGSASGNPAGAFCIAASSRNPTSNPRKPITAIDIDATSGRFTITVLPPVNFTVGSKVHVSGARGPGTRGINADAYIVSYNTTSGVAVLSTYPTCHNTALTWSGKPVVYLRAPTLFPITSKQYERWIKRDTGRAFFGTRGRRSSARC